MKRTLRQIVETITQKANEIRTNATYGGEHGDGGASKLEQDLEFFVLGFNTHSDAIIDEHGKGDWVVMGAQILKSEKEIDVPVSWQKYFYRQDPEYDEYLRLKNKFENKS
jgi:hypothetical protein